jgi:5'-3' exonuclease
MAKTFQTMSELDPEVLMIVDSLNLAFRYKHSGALDFVDDYRRTVDSLRKSYNAGKVVMACDSGASKYRKELYPLYKQNRKDKQDLQTPEEEAEFQLFFEEFNRTMETYNTGSYPLFRFPGVEADDVASYIVKTRRHYPIKKIVLISSDRDWDLLVSEDVMRFSYVTRKEVTLDNWTMHYDCDPEEYISIKCLQGDSGDNVPGVPGIGPKRAAELVKKYGSTYDVIASMPISGKYKYIDNLNKFGAEALMLNYQLMDLLEFCDEAVGTQNCTKIDDVLKEYLNGK